MIVIVGAPLGAACRWCLSSTVFSCLWGALVAVWPRYGAIKVVEIINNNY